MAETYTGQVVNGVIVLDEGTPPLPEGARIRVETIEGPGPRPRGDDTIARTRAFLLAAARAAEAAKDECPLPSDLAENHDSYAHGRPRS
jgi:hypothetical protein